MARLEKYKKEGGDLRNPLRDSGEKSVGDGRKDDSLVKKEEWCRRGTADL